MFDILLYSALLPIAISAVVLFIACWRRNDAAPSEAIGTSNRPMLAAGAIAFAVAYLVCHFGVHGFPAGTQLEAWEWLLGLAPLAALLGILNSIFSLPRWGSLFGWVVLAAVSAWLLVPSFQESPWVWRIVLGLAVLTLIVAQTYVITRASIGLVLVSWIITGACALPVLLASANAKFGFFATSVSAAAGGAFAIWTFRRSQVHHLSKSAIPVVSLLFPAILLSGHFNDYGDVPLAAFALLLVAPLGLLVFVPMDRLQERQWISGIAALLSVAVLCGTSLYLAWPALTAEPAY